MVFLQSSFCYVCLLLIYSVQAVLARASVVPVVVLVEAEPISVGPAKNEKQKTMGYRAETKKKVVICVVDTGNAMKYMINYCC